METRPLTRAAVAALLLTSLVGVLLIWTLVWSQNQQIRSDREDRELRGRNQEQLIANQGKLLQSQADILAVQQQVLEHLQKVETACRIDGPFSHAVR